MEDEVEITVRLPADIAAELRALVYKGESLDDIVLAAVYRELRTRESQVDLSED